MCHAPLTLPPPPCPPCCIVQAPSPASPYIAGAEAGRFSATSPDYSPTSPPDGIGGIGIIPRALDSAGDYDVPDADGGDGSGSDGGILDMMVIS